METSLATKLKVGLTTALALVLLFSGVLWVKEYNPLKKRDIRKVLFLNAKGITAGDPVTVSGIKVGEIVHVGLHNDMSALIEYSILGEIVLYSDCSVSIQDVGLMGDKALVIVPGSTPPAIDPQDVYRGLETTGLSDLVSIAEEVMGRLNRIGATLEDELDIKTLTDSFEETAGKLNDALTLISSIAEENRVDLKQSITSLGRSADELHGFIENNGNHLEDAIVSFRKTSDKISVALDNMENIAGIVDTLSAHMSANDGTFSKLLKSDELYEELRQTNANIDSFVVDFKRNPGKYTKDMQFKVRLF